MKWRRRSDEQPGEACEGSSMDVSHVDDSFGLPAPLPWPCQVVKENRIAMKNMKVF